MLKHADLEDCDKILRMETEFLGANSIIEKLESAGVMCAELELSTNDAVNY